MLELHGAGLTVEHLERVGIERPSVVHLIPRCAEGVADPQTELLRVTEGEDRSSGGPHPNQGQAVGRRIDIDKTLPSSDLF